MPDALLAMVDLFVLLGDGLVVVLLLAAHLLLMLVEDGLLGTAVAPSLVLLQLLQSLILCGVFQHPLRVLVAASLDFLVVLLGLLPELLLKLILDLALAGFQLLDLAPNHQSLT